MKLAEWVKNHKWSLVVMVLAIGLIVPFVLATGCVVIAASSQFHGKPDDILAMVNVEDPSSKEAKDLQAALDHLEKTKNTLVGKQRTILYWY